MTDLIVERKNMFHLSFTTNLSELELYCSLLFSNKMNICISFMYSLTNWINIACVVTVSIMLKMVCGKRYLKYGWEIVILSNRSAYETYFLTCLVHKCLVIAVNVHLNTVAIIWSEYDSDLTFIFHAMQIWNQEKIFI